MKYVQIDTSNVHQLMYKLQTNRVSIDEKWSYVSGARNNLNYLPDHETKRHKSHIDKANGYIRIVTANDDESDRKKGLIVHGDFIPAQRRSVSCERGTIEIHSKIVDHMDGLLMVR